MASACLPSLPSARRRWPLRRRRPLRQHAGRFGGPEAAALSAVAAPSSHSASAECSTRTPLMPPARVVSAAPGFGVLGRRRPLLARCSGASTRLVIAAFSSRGARARRRCSLCRHSSLRRPESFGGFGRRRFGPRGARAQRWRSSRRLREWLQQLEGLRPAWPSPPSARAARAARRRYFPFRRKSLRRESLRRWGGCGSLCCRRLRLARRACPTLAPSAPARVAPAAQWFRRVKPSPPSARALRAAWR